MSEELPEKPLLDHVIDFLEMVRRILIFAILLYYAGSSLYCTMFLHDVASKQVRKRQKRPKNLLRSV